jgi:hypothetical protein
MYGKNGLNIRPDGIEQRCALMALARPAICYEDLYSDWVGAEKFLERATYQLYGYKNVIGVNRMGHDKVMEMYDKAITLSMEKDRADMCICVPGF